MKNVCFLPGRNLSGENQIRLYFESSIIEVVGEKKLSRRYLIRPFDDIKVGF